MPPKKKQPGASTPPSPTPDRSEGPAAPPTAEWIAARLNLAAEAVDEFVRSVPMYFDRDADGYVSPPPFTVDYAPNPRMDAAWNTPSLLYRAVEHIAEILLAVGLTRSSGERLEQRVSHAWVSGGSWTGDAPWTRLAEQLVPIGQGLAVRRAEFQAGFERDSLTYKKVLAQELKRAMATAEWLRYLSQVTKGETPTPPRFEAWHNSSPTNEPKTDDPRFAHAADFSWIIWDGVEYQLAKGQLAAIVGALWEEWEKSGRRNGCGLSEATLADAAESGNAKFRVVHVLRRYPALARIVKSAGKGKFALFSESHS